MIPVDKFTLGKQDFEWHELTAATHLPAGIHMIGIRFLEDTGDLTIELDTI